MAVAEWPSPLAKGKRSGACWRRYWPDDLPFNWANTFTDETGDERPVPCETGDGAHDGPVSGLASCWGEKQAIGEPEGEAPTGTKTLGY
jgi:hypothetical protein